ncbi:MAG: hypothetical protein PHR87_09440 [Sulfurospirillaceae bacterium]|nr:hypothetical protein [Sulfurospirillaceae bacterium]
MIDLLTRISVLYNIPQWAVNLGALAIFIFLIATPFIAKKLMEPKYYKFREMVMFNVLWKWKYRKDEISLLWCYCPTCQGMLMCDDENCRSTEDLQNKNTFFICNDCGGNEQGRVIGGDRRYVLSLVKREIWRQIRSLEYIETMKKSKELKDTLLAAEKLVEEVTKEVSMDEVVAQETLSENSKEEQNEEASLVVPEQKNESEIAESIESKEVKNGI